MKNSLIKLLVFIIIAGILVSLRTHKSINDDDESVAYCIVSGCPREIISGNYCARYKCNNYSCNNKIEEPFNYCTECIERAN